MLSNSRKADVYTDVSGSKGPDKGSRNRETTLRSITTTYSKVSLNEY